MSSEVIKLRKVTQDDLSTLADQIARYNSSSDLVLSQIRHVDHVDILLMVFEKYFMRNGSMAVLTVEVVSDGNNQTATVVGTGGGQGIFNISWGANSDYAYETAEFLESIGFKEC